MHAFIRYTLLAALAFPGLLQADDSRRAIEAEMEIALLNLSERNALSDAGTRMVVSSPSQVRYELGAVVDVREPDPQGLEVLAITPDGAAARMGLQTGDRLLAINGQRLDGDTSAADVLVSALEDSEGELELLASRDGARITVAGPADIVGIPAYTLAIGDDAATADMGCGYVSYSRLPPRSENLFPAVITTIDGRSTPLRRVNRLDVSAGRHVLTIQEFIPARRLSGTQNRSRALTKRHLQARAYKPLVVDVRPNVSYRVGVRLLKDRLSSESIRNNEYWEPVVWEQVAQDCP